MSTIRKIFDDLKLEDKLNGVIQSWAALKTETLSPQNLEDIERLIKALNAISAQINNIDIELYPSATWTKISNYVSNIQTHATNFKNSKTVGYIQNANNEIDAMLAIFGPTPLGHHPKLSGFFTQSEKDFTQEVLKLLGDVNSSREAWTNQLRSFAQSLDELKARLAQTDQTIQSQKQRLDTSITQFQNQFSEAQETRRNDFSATTQKKLEEFKAFMQTAKATFDTENARFASQHMDTLNGALKTFEEYAKTVSGIEKEVRRIFNVVGNVALTGNYEKIADRDSKEADKFRWIALGLMGSMALIAATTFIHGLFQANLDWKLFAFRLGTTLILALPALYAAQESAKHREREKLNRKLHLELSAIDAYLALLPVEEKNKIKGQLTEKFFGQNEPQSKEEQLTQHKLFNLLTDAIKALGKIK